MTSYKNSFSLCSGASYGAGYKLMIAGSTFTLLASLLRVCSMFCGDTDEDEDSDDDLSYERSRHKIKRKLPKAVKKMPAGLKRLPAKLKSWKKRKRNRSKV